PWAILPAAFLFGAMRSGAGFMQLETQVSSDLISIVQATVIMFVAAPLLVRWIFRLRETPAAPVHIAEAGGLAGAGASAPAPAVGVLAALVSGLLIASLQARLSIGFLVDQLVSGTVINVLALGITGVFYRTFLQETNVRGPGTLPVWKLPLLGELPVLGPIL